MNYRLVIVIGILGCNLAVAATAELKLPAVIGNHMVLQQDRPVPVWGTATPGEKITVRFAGQEKHTTANPDGQWLVRLDRLKASTKPRTLTITGSDAAHPVEITDVLVGEVWVC